MTAVRQVLRVGRENFTLDWMPGSAMDSAARNFLQTIDEEVSDRMTTVEDALSYTSQVLAAGHDWRQDRRAEAVARLRTVPDEDRTQAALSAIGALLYLVEGQWGCDAQATIDRVRLAVAYAVPTDGNDEEDPTEGGIDDPAA